MEVVVINDGVMLATFIEDSGWVCVEWLTNKIGYLSKTVVKDLHKVEDICRERGYKGWLLGSEPENTGMHKLIEKFGGRYVKDEAGYKIFAKQVIRRGN